MSGVSKTRKHDHYDLIILGGGAAGLMCAAVAGKRGKRILILEVSNKIGKKILMSGGGRCNFTNLEVLPDNFLSQNPHFCKSALKQYTQWDFISLVAKYGIAYEERKHQQLFCEGSAKEILAMLRSECDKSGVTIQTQINTQSVEYNEQNQRFLLNCEQQPIAMSYSANSLVVATGGLSIPTLGGATGFAYSLAEQFGLRVLPRTAALVPFTLSGGLLELSTSISGVSIPINVTVKLASKGKQEQSFFEDMLFTHRGISGPSILQISSYWKLGNEIEIDLLPHENIQDIEQAFLAVKNDYPNKQLKSLFTPYFPKSLALALTMLWAKQNREKTLQEWKKTELIEFAQRLKSWCFKPSGTEGYRTAEVTLGGIDTEQISSKTMEVINQKGLYFIGEALDVTGHLGGYNFQWAWSSAYVAGQNC